MTTTVTCRPQFDAGVEDGLALTFSTDDVGLSFLCIYLLRRFCTQYANLVGVPGKVVRMQVSNTPLPGFHSAVLNDNDWTLTPAFSQEPICLNEEQLQWFQRHSNGGAVWIVVRVIPKET